MEGSGINALALHVANYIHEQISSGVRNSSSVGLVSVLQVKLSSREADIDRLASESERLSSELRDARLELARLKGVEKKLACSSEKLRDATTKLRAADRDMRKMAAKIVSMTGRIQA